MQNNSLIIPISIVIAGAFIAGAVYFTNSNSSGGIGLTESSNTSQQNSDASGTLRPVDENDHIRGNPNAQIVIVEYSDYECPFCKNFHETMKQVMSKYGIDGKVAWVYRHFPLQQLHPNAPKLASAAECVADLAGNDAFWEFSDLVFGERGTNESTDMSRLSEFAETAGADRAKFSSCLANNTFQQKVNDSLSEAFAVGGKGTPYSFILVGDQQGIINGAQPYETVSKIIEGLLTQLKGGAIDG